MLVRNGKIWYSNCRKAEIYDEKRETVTTLKIKNSLLTLLFSALLAGELAVLADLAAAWQGMETQRTVFFGGIAVLTAAFFFIPCFTQKRLMGAAAGIPALIAVTAAVGFLFWKSFSTHAVYRDVDSGKAQLYAGRRVMLIVPHEDDEINVLGGVMEEYMEYGSELYPVFVTNGDYSGIAEERFAEAMAVAEYIGIPAENVTFLGYGDQWKEGGPHIYNAEPGMVMESHAGKTQTYGTQSHAAFREGRAYTVDHLMEDMEAVILKYRPDIIFCSDYDSHIDHKATSLVFEKVMGRILKAETEYRPAVFKGYAYKTAWKAEPDFYETNILSTKNVFGEPQWQRPEVYRWEERVRLPVDAGALSRSIYSSGIYQTLALHVSQGANAQANRVINGDRVFWKRETDSLCYDAVIQTSSASPEVLNDFMLTDNFDLADEKRLPYDGTWVPAAEDTQKWAVVSFSEPVDLSQIVLYDHPSEEHNVLDAVIRFDDGTEIRTGPLDPGGAASRIPAAKNGVSTFTVTLCEAEGNQAGLTEIEAYRDAPERDFHYIKIMDEEDNFVYDYWVSPDGKAEFGLYVYGDAATERRTVSSDNTRCKAVMEDDLLKVDCPVGEAAVITVSCGETGSSESIYVCNPGFFQRLQCRLGQKLEEIFLQGYLDGRYWNSMTYEILDIAKYKLADILP